MPILPRSSVAVGLDALRANPLRALLSTLGVVMGVGAMVSVLALSDGVERYAREQLEQTTDLLGVTLTPTTTATVDGQSVRRDDIVRFTRDDVTALGASVAGWEKMALITSGTALGTIEGEEAPRGLAVMGVLATHFRDAGMTLVAGAPFADTDTAVVVLDRRAAALVAGDTAAPERAVGREMGINGAAHRVVAVVEGGRRPVGALVAYVPVEDASRAIPGTRVPVITIVAGRIEAVESLRAAAERWVLERYGPRGRERITVGTNQARVAQASTAMRVFRLLMGAITGVSLLVGGVGIMNVLLAAVAERTREIGIRKATGARDRDILAQFLAESVTITGAGAALGVLLGLGIAFLTAAIMRAQTNAPVHAAVTPGTVLFAAGLSILIGLVFGLYPALRAARLSPIDAIRHE